MYIFRTHWTCIALIGSICLSQTGCGNGSQNVALIGGIALATYGVGREVVTGSSAKVTVERYDDVAGGGGVSFNAKHGLAFGRATTLPTIESDSPAGPFAGMGAMALARIHSDLAPHMREIEEDHVRAKEMEIGFEQIPDDTIVWKDVAADFKDKASRLEPVLKAWDEFDKDAANGALRDDAKLEVVAAAAIHLNELKIQLDSVRPVALSNSYVVAVKAFILVRGDKSGLKDDDLRSAIEAAEKAAPPDNAARVSALLQAADDAVKVSDPPSANGGAATTQITADMKKTWTAAVKEVRNRFISAYKVTLKTNADLNDARAVLYNLSNSNVSIGPISNEVTQMVFTPDAMNQVLKPKNEKFWRMMNSCEVNSGPGNTDTVIYFENLLHPVLKSTNFDPSKFLVANGLIYRKAFATVAQVFGVAGAAGGDTSMPNIMSINATIANADESVAAAKKLRMDALKGILKAAEDSKVTAAQGKTQLTDISKKLTPASK